ncbi:MAG: lactate utilization protein B/C [Pedobacter sp.]|nr:MAG: lactate utilization protein B/C [Pedobacter sp.]
MNSRERILSRVKSNQPELIALPNPFMVAESAVSKSELLEQFKTVLTTIGGAVIELNSVEEIKNYIQDNFRDRGRIISTLPELSDVTEVNWENQGPHSYETIDLAIINAHFGVAENAALWITEDLMHQRVVPFICQQLAVVISASKILPSMHHAYDLIGTSEYGFGSFIAGPSKTADIEQSLVLGAHGPKSMIAFLIP